MTAFPWKPYRLTGDKLVSFQAQCREEGISEDDTDFLLCVDAFNWIMFLLQDDTGRWFVLSPFRGQIALGDYLQRMPQWRMQ